LGSVSLLCALILVCVVVLTVLCIATVRADWLLTRRGAEVTQQHYELQNQAQLWLAQTDAALRSQGWEAATLPQGSERRGESITTTLQRENMKLTITLEPGEGELYRIKEWRSAREWDEEENLSLFLPDN
jgi:hypothetical protein